jgi:hypothetical protein
MWLGEGVALGEDGHGKKTIPWGGDEAEERMWPKKKTIH